MNAKQRRKARRQGRDTPYYDGFKTHEERIEHQKTFLLAKRQRYEEIRKLMGQVLFGKNK